MRVNSYKQRRNKSTRKLRLKTRETGGCVEGLRLSMGVSVVNV